MTRRAPAALASSGARRLVGQGLRWQVLVTIPASLILAALITYSLRGAISWVIVVCIVGLHRHRRSWGIYALLAFWCVAPEIRRVMDQLTGYQASDPLSLAPFIATALLAAIEFYEYRLPVVVRRVLLLALIGFVVGLPVGILHPRSGLYALAAYAFGVAALVLGANESRSLNHGTLRRFLLVGAPLVALYAIFAQRLLPLPSWERAWLGDVSFNSIGANAGGQVRVFGTLNAPGTLAPLLGPGPGAGGDRRGRAGDRAGADVRPLLLAGAADRGVGARRRLPGAQCAPGARRRGGGDRADADPVAGELDRAPGRQSSGHLRPSRQ
jgi:hypothetical protein